MKKDKWTGKTVKVDWKHIAKGEPSDPESCPIAFAVKELGGRNVEVTSEIIEIGGKEYHLPAKAEQFVGIFDEDRTSAKPITFKIGNKLEEPTARELGSWDY